MYKIIGGDGNEYGPVSAETMRQWIAENRVNSETKVRGETTEWKPLAEFPEFAAGAAQPQPSAGGAPAPFATASFARAERREIFDGDYQLDMGGCISRGWALLKANFGVLFGAVMIYFGVQFLLSILSVIPLIGVLFTLASWVITGPLMGGLLYLFLRVVRGEAAGPGDVFDGFRRAFGQLFLGQLVTSLLMGLCLLPALVAGVIMLIPTISEFKGAGLVHLVETFPANVLVAVGGVFLLCLIPLLYLQVSWMFTLPLILDKGLEFWPAMKLSWQRVNVHWWQLFGLMVLVGLVNVLGLLMCFVGILVTVPIGLAALMYAYETIFSGDNSKTS